MSMCTHRLGLLATKKNFDNKIFLTWVELYKILQLVSQAHIQYVKPEVFKIQIGLSGDN